MTVDDDEHWLVGTDHQPLQELEEHLRADRALMQHEPKVPAAALFEVARLRRLTRDYGLSLGDRACLALARQSSLPALTTDKAWHKAASATKISVKLVR